MTDLNVPLINFKVPMPEFTPAHVQEAKRFRSAFREIKAGLTELLKPDEELALFYFTGAEDIIRVRHIQIQRDMLVLLYGSDTLGNYACAVTHVKEVKLVFKKLKLDEKKERTPIGFSLAGEKEAPTPER